MTPARRSTRVQDLQMKQEEELRERSITPELPELDELASIELPASVNAEEYAVINSSGTNADKNSPLPASVITQLSDSEDDATEVPDNQVAGKVDEATENGVEGGSEQGEDEDEEMADAEENE